jgi:hypothetical protein
MEAFLVDAFAPRGNRNLINDHHWSGPAWRKYMDFNNNGNILLRSMYGIVGELPFDHIVI